MCERWKVMNGILFSLIYKMCLLLTSGQTLISVTRRQTQGNCTKSSRCGISTQILERSFWVFWGVLPFPKSLLQGSFHGLLAQPVWRAGQLKRSWTGPPKTSSLFTVMLIYFICRGTTLGLSQLSTKWVKTEMIFSTVSWKITIITFQTHLILLSPNKNPCRQQHILQCSDWHTWDTHHTGSVFFENKPNTFW